MEPQQNPTNASDVIDTKRKSVGAYTLTPQQQAWIDYKALSGIVYENDMMRKMTVEEFATRVGVHRDTLYAWRNQIPNFWQRVDERRRELGATEWLVKMHEKWKIKALAFDNWQISEAWLINFDSSYKTPKLKVEHELGDSMADALNLARERSRQIGSIQEGEVVDVQQTDN
jgi:hypothetical protein